MPLALPKIMITTPFLGLFVVLALFFATPSSAQLFLSEGKPLRIAVFSDVHYGGGALFFCKESRNAKTLALLRSALASQPFDLAVITGDLVNGYAFFKHSSSIEAYKEAVQPFIDAKIPFAFTLGNHDYESPGDLRVTMEELNKFAYPYSKTLLHETVTGITNYHLPIYTNSTLTDVAAALVFLDTGSDGCISKTVGCIQEDQFHWMEDVAANYTLRYKKKVPIVEFHHVPALELLDWWSREDAECRAFFKNEAICCSVNPYNISSIASKSGIVATFSGHDHKNLFECSKDNYTIAYNPKLGDCSYGDSIGYRVITIQTGRERTPLADGFHELKTWDRNLAIGTAIYNVNNTIITNTVVEHPRYSVDAYCKKGVFGQMNIDDEETDSTAKIIRDKADVDREIERILKLREELWRNGVINEHD